MSRRVLVLLSTLLSSAFAFGDGSIWYVASEEVISARALTEDGDGSESAPFLSIQTAVVAETTQSGDTIVLMAGTHLLRERASVSTNHGVLLDDKLRPGNARLTIRGATGRAEDVVIRPMEGVEIGCIHSSADDCVFRDFTLENGATSTNYGGGGFRLTRSTIISNCVIRGGYTPSGTASGGAIIATSGRQVYRDLVISNNVMTTSNSGSALVHVQTQASEPFSIVNCLFSDNRTNDQKLFYSSASGAHELRDCEFSDNNSGSGSLVQFYGNTASVYDCRFIGNTTQYSILRNHKGAYRCVFSGNTCDKVLANNSHTYNSLIVSNLVIVLAMVNVSITRRHNEPPSFGIVA